MMTMRLLALLLVVLAGPAASAAAGPEGHMTWGVHTTLVPTYFDPGETTIGTSHMVLYGLHDALVKPMPGKNIAPSLAESWTLSPDGLIYDFVLRRGARFHNGDPVTAEDAKFSFDRFRGIYAKTLKDRVGGSGAPVLQLHGFSQTPLMWRDVAPRLARRFTVVCADLRG
jgi:peptide/nickel transport system substrate-binding protein